MARFSPFCGLLLAACTSGDLTSGDDDQVDASGFDAAPAIDATPPRRCAPAAGGPYWLVEGETVSFAVSCTTGETATFAFAGLPEGAECPPPPHTALAMHKRGQESGCGKPIQVALPESGSRPCPARRSALCWR
jgi:hypothetical protein